MWKAILALGLWALPLLGGCRTARSAPERGSDAAATPPPIALAAPAPAGPAAEPGRAAALFAARALPVLEANCSPCHFPGGKLYDRLPFDDPATVSGAGEGIVKRLKGEDLAAVRQYLDAVGD